MKEIVKEFYEKQISYNKFFEKKKKISFDTNEHFLEIIDKLAKLTSNNRTMIINALMGAGMAPLFKIFEDQWKKHMNEYEGKKKEEFKKSMNKLIEDLRKLKREYHIE